MADFDETLLDALALVFAEAVVDKLLEQDEQLDQLQERAA